MSLNSRPAAKYRGSHIPHGSFVNNVSLWLNLALTNTNWPFFGICFCTCRIGFCHWDVGLSPKRHMHAFGSGQV